jgi:hypothetical protein
MVLWGHEHQWRATNLAHVLNEKVAEAAPLVATPANIPACSDATLTIWGHGGPDEFAEMAATQLGDFIKAWKKKNASLSTVELLTCDARHSPDADNRDAYTDKLIPLLINSGKILINVKSLPRGGSTATTSELWATEAAGSNGYYFLAADDDASLAAAVQVFDAAWAGLPAGAQDYAHLFPVAKAAMDKAAMKGPLRYVASYGTFDKLRALLVNVTVYIQTGQRLAVPKVLAT